MMQQECNAGERGKGEENVLRPYGTLVLFHAPFRAENYNGARDSLWECILNGSERTANDTRDFTSRHAPLTPRPLLKLV